MLLLLQIVKELENIYNKQNFHKYTFCVFQEIEIKKETNFIINYKSKSGSSYAFTDEGVYRISNHWGRAANCRWRLNAIENYKSQTEKCGYAKWTDFYPNNESENLFYIDVNWNSLEVLFQHKNNPDYKDAFLLRNASATAKRIQNINEVLKTDSWCKYLGFDNLLTLRKDIVHELITTNESFLKIKQKYVR